MRLSVIIPTLNEEENIEAILHALGDCLRESDEVVIADAGSNDATVSIAEVFDCIVLSELQKGRARQLNAAAKIARGDVLLFLHADTILKKESVNNLASVLERHPKVIGGGFYREFDSLSLVLKFTCWVAGLRGKFWRVFLGDQAMFIRKAAFEKLGRFDETLPYGEDLDLSIRMRRDGKTRIVGPSVISSARRFDREGPARQTWIDLKLALQLVFRRT